MDLLDTLDKVSGTAGTIRNVLAPTPSTPATAPVTKPPVRWPIFVIGLVATGAVIVLGLVMANRGSK